MKTRRRAPEPKRYLESESPGGKGAPEVEPLDEAAREIAEHGADGAPGPDENEVQASQGL